MEMNLLEDGDWPPRTWPPEKPGFKWRRKRVSGQHLGASLYAIPPGNATFPYHYELGNDELLVVVAGSPSVRTPEGEKELKVGDCIYFPSGEVGAHQVINRSEHEARVLLVSSFASMPRGAVQPDSRKMMIRWGLGEDERAWFPLEAAADYWEGEEPRE